MPIKFHPVVFDLKWKQEDSLISSDSASTEALSLEELYNPREIIGFREARLSELKR